MTNAKNMFKSSSRQTFRGYLIENHNPSRYAVMLNYVNIYKYEKIHICIIIAVLCETALLK